MQCTPTTLIPQNPPRIFLTFTSVHVTMGLELPVGSDGLSRGHAAEDRESFQFVRRQ